jgi:hypothetical protein
MVGMTNISQFAAPPKAEDLHQVRNAIAAFTFASEVHHGTDPYGPYDLVTTLPGIAPRHGGKSRPATDDEILLTRSRAIHSVLRAGRYTKGASQYALAESGAHPVETTAIRPCDFDSTTSPTSVHVHGGTWYKPRRVLLTPFARRILAVTIDAFFAARPGAHQAPLCSDCTTKGSSSASATANLKRHAEDVGLVAPSLEGTYATRWRAHKELRDAGVFPALYLIGKNHAKGEEYDDPRRVYEFLNLPPRPVVIEVEDDDEDEDLRNCG